MIFHANDSALAKRVAKSLKQELSSLGIETTLGQCHNVVASMHGFAHWREMEANLGRHEPSPDDGAATPQEVAIRRMRHVAVLTGAFPQLGTGAPSIVDAIAPTAWRPRLAPVPMVHNVVLHVIRDGEHPGAALSWVSEDGPSTCGLALWKGYLWAYSSKIRFADTELLRAAINEWTRTNGATKKGVSLNDHLGYALVAFGFRQDPDLRADPAAALAGHPEAARARSVIHEIADSAALKILSGAGASKMTMTRDYAFYADAGPMRARRHAFAAKYPEFAIHAIGDRGSVSPIDQHTDPDDAMQDVLKRQMCVRDDVDMTDIAFARMRGARWDLEFDNQLGCLGGVLARIPEAEIPCTRLEREALIELCWHLENAIEDQVPRCNDYAASVAMTIPGKDWIARLAKWNKEGSAGVERLAAKGIELWEKDSTPQDPIDSFYGNLDRTMATFMYGAVEPALARTNETVRHLHLSEPKGGTNFGKGNVYLLPPTTFENSCASLFLDGITHREFVALMEASHLFDRANGYRRLPHIKDLDPEKIAARFDLCRHLLRPQHRDITSDDVVAMSLAGIKEAGQEIAEPSLIIHKDDDDDDEVDFQP
jgi:hypothetical protein